MTKFDFLKTALRDYKVGAFLPSSRYSLHRVLEELGHECAYVVEYGPGDGVSTRAVLEQVLPAGRMIAIESNPDFLPELKSIHDPRLNIVLGDVCVLSEDLNGLGLLRIDAVVSSIPFSFFPSRVCAAIVRNTFDALAPGGKFIVYQYSPLMVRYLKQYFPSVRIRFEPRNIPPCFIMVGEK
jgi:phospholipid N-methyltransferase